MTKRFYLDYNATAPVRPEVIDFVARVMAEEGNPSSVHGAGRTARSRVEEARHQLAALLSCKAPEIIFTSGGTEANNLALGCAMERSLAISAQEHDSVRAPANARNPVLLPVTEDGLLDLEALSSVLEEMQSPLVSVMYANNETGVLQPIAEIAERVHAAGGLLHCDAIQAVGKIPVDFRELKLDMMSVSAHKFGGPQGAGALILREGLTLSPRQSGGGQELGRRAGTENVAAIAGFGLAASLAEEGIADASRLAAFRDMMETEILKLSPSSVIYGAKAPRLANTSCISMPGVPAELQVMNLDLAGIAVSAGSACSSGKVKASHVLQAMGADDMAAGSAIRISLGRMTGEAAVSALVRNWGELYARKSPAASGGGIAGQHRSPALSKQK